MSLAAICAWSFLRSASIALIAALVSKRLAACVGWVESSRSTGLQGAKSEVFGFRASSYNIAWVLLLAPFLVPHLLVGYAYSALALKLIYYPSWNEAAYGLLLWLKFFPAAVVIQVFAPPSPVSAEAIHLQRLLRRPDESWLKRASRELGSWIAGPGRAAIGAFVVVFLLAFQEFEIASLMGITGGDTHSPVSWTVWLFDAHAGGVPLAESLRYVVTPLVFELCVVLPALAVLPLWMSPGLPTRREVGGGRRFFPTEWGLLLLAALLLAGVPSVVVVRGALRGLESLPNMRPALREIVIGAATAVAAAGLAWMIQRSLFKQNPRRSGRAFAVAALSLPGLLGPLVLSLLILGLFQLPGFRALSQSLVPVILALVLFVLPRAAVVFAVTGVSRRTQAAHTAWMLARSPSADRRRSAARLIDDLEIKGIFWSTVLVWYWAYWEMTPASLLAPPGAMSFSVRLYNFMHYGQSGALSTMLLVAIALPIATIVSLALLRPLIVRWAL